MSNENTDGKATKYVAESTEPRDTNSARTQKRREAGSARLTEIVPYQFNTKQIRTVFRDGEVWFVADDVCDVLELSNSSDSLSRLDADERNHVQVQTGENNRRMGVINESGLFALVLTSDKPEARVFRRWITSEVLPAIRRTGRYTQQQTLDPAIEHSDIADIIERRAGIYIVVINHNQRTMQHTNGGEIITIVSEAMSTIMAGALISAEGALTMIQSKTLVSEPSEQLALEGLEAAVSQGATIAKRYVAMSHYRTADAEVPPVGLPH